MGVLPRSGVPLLEVPPRRRAVGPPGTPFPGHGQEATWGEGLSPIRHVSTGDSRPLGHQGAGGWGPGQRAGCPASHPPTFSWEEGRLCPCSQGMKSGGAHKGPGSLTPSAGHWVASPWRQPPRAELPRECSEPDAHTLGTGLCGHGAGACLPSAAI